ncbi:hypothetical protein ROZALSC1DRAFT_11675, partial [Rozella allomycis CSF55]
LVEISPISLTVDYKPKGIDIASLKEGNLSELFNLLRLENAGINLGKLRISGIHGIQNLVETLMDAWMDEINKCEITGILQAIYPFKSAINIGKGLVDLIILPVESFKEHGDLLKAIKKGLSSFTKSASNEVLKLGTSMVVSTETFLDQIERILTGHDLQRQSKFASPPQNALQGKLLSYFQKASFKLTSLFPKE